MNTQDKYTAKEIESLFGEIDGKKIFKVSRIQDYCLKGYVIPEHDSSGPGTIRYFSPRNIVELALVNELFLRGVHRDQIKLVMDKLRYDFSTIENGSTLLNPKSPPPPGDKLIFTVHFKQNNVFDFATLDVLTGANSRKSMPDLRVIVAVDIAKITREIGAKCFGYKYF